MCSRGIASNVLRSGTATRAEVYCGTYLPRSSGATQMKRAIAAVLTVGVLAFHGFACAQDGPVMKRLAETKTITIGHRDASVPLSYLGPDGKVQGYSIDICLK